MKNRIELQQPVAYPHKKPSSSRWKTRSIARLMIGLSTCLLVMTFVSGAIAQTNSNSAPVVASPSSDSEDDATNVTERTKKTASTKKPGGTSSASIAEFEPVKLVTYTGDFSTKAAKEYKVDRSKPAAANEESKVYAQDDPAKPASNGTNPAELITRIEVKYQYQNFAFGDIHGIAIVRGDYAITPKVAFRMDLPILHFNSKTPGLTSESGIGDIVTSMTFVKVFSKRFVGAVVPRIDFPTATHSTLGSGKYSFKPLIAGVTPLGKGLGLVGTIEHRVSFAGKADRADINETALRAILLKSFLSGPLKGYYVNPQLEIVIDYEINNRTTTQFAVNMGKVLSKNVVVFVVPTFHLAGTKRENFKLEAGFRYLFR